jgi:hypothetical protein
MIISVVYQNNKMGLVDDSKLDDLISSNKRNGYDYKGREKRQLFKTKT